MATSARGPPGTVARPTPPNQTLYVRNLNDKLQKADLKRNLYMLFATYGVVLDVVALKTTKMRGQAHVVFRDVDSSTQAMRALQGFEFFGKPMNIQYAKGKSDTVKKLDGTFQLPEREEPKSTETTTAQESVFGTGPAPTKAKPVNEPAAPAAPAAPTAEESTKGVKRAREEEEEEEDEGAAMDVSDSE
ncbi:U2 small nuclear ribonucleoprotein B [Westerdykella ornata]|uniref:U2 small nuclear ribonucleoprotein B n=1 Tax=Westerdykella ornata TaxID=318751 RepID=A0A6A6K0L8_WESOR|nr:U2 small nuclear ribonucleoprotein B [Westerdykella ornata]KAF2280869.1 U2 small nuclear ribonucleoprotein B [Westerdykella ornata]